MVPSFQFVPEPPLNSHFPPSLRTQDSEPRVSPVLSAIVDYALEAELAFVLLAGLTVIVRFQLQE